MSWTRDATRPVRVTNIELFFDLVYVFAVTQLSHYLLGHASPQGALQTALLLALVWQAWVYTTWFTNWFDPQRIPVRLMLLLLMLMLISLVLAVALPQAFGAQGLTVGLAYATAQVTRSAFAVVGLRGESLQRNYQRILSWCLVSGALAVTGGLVHGHAREALWLGTVGVELLGGAIGFATPGLGRSVTEDWTLDGRHFAERCQAFLIIALGESVVVIGATLSGLHTGGVLITVAFGAVFAGAVSLWWLYFDRSAEDAVHLIERSPDPGRLGRSAYHFVHPIMIAGIVVSAAADQQVLAAPAHVADPATAWLILGGTALYLAGHAAFIAVVWHAAPWIHLLALAVLDITGVALVHLRAVAVPLQGLALLAVVLVTAASRPAR